LLLLTLTVGVFLYTYIIILYLILFTIGLSLTGRKFRQIWLVIIPFCLPYNFIVTLSVIRDQFLSGSKELSLLGGMQGNLSNYLSPFMAMSLWFSNTHYLVQGMRVSNMWLVAAVVLILIVFRPTIKHWRLIFVLSFPVLIMLVLSFITRSPYQNAKVLQLTAVLWPIILYLMFKSHRPAVYTLVAFLMIASGLYSLRYIGKPVIAADLTLLNQENQICSNSSQSLEILNRDEWSKYFLFNCATKDFYFDRMINWNGLVEFNQFNHRDYISQACADNSLSLPGTFKPQSQNILIDKCIHFTDPKYKLSHSYGPMNLYVSF
jgi:hypothetical protein